MPATLGMACAWPRPPVRRRDSHPCGRPDRALRALSQAEPSLVAALIRRLLPGVLPEGAQVTPEDVDDPHLPGPMRERIGDFLARFGQKHVIRIEYQCYHDNLFGQRLFEGHLACVIRYPGRTVVSIALWIIRPWHCEKWNVIRVGTVTVEAEVIVLPDVPAESLLDQPGLACFAIGAARGEMSVQDLCRRVVEAMRRDASSRLAWRVAAAIAVARRRYKAWEEAMKQADVESQLFPEEREMYQAYFYEEGQRSGRRKGRAQGMHEALLATYRARFGLIPATIRRAVTASQDTALLLRWQGLFSTGTAADIAAALRPSLSSPSPRRMAQGDGLRGRGTP